MTFSRLVLGALALALASPAQAAQRPDRPREARGFDFSRDGVWRVRARSVRAARETALRYGATAALNSPMASRLTGVLRTPVFLVAYRNTVPASLRAPAEYQQVLLSPSAPGRPYTLRSYYEEISDSVFSIQGQVIGWITLDSSDTWYEGTCNGLGCSGSHMAQLIREAVEKADSTIDFGQFDSDGPDGIPNSGDDDGVVDLVTIIQPERGGECAGSTNIWSHRFYYEGWTGTSLASADPKRAGGNPLPGSAIRINDYTIQTGVGGPSACQADSIMAPGTIAHETGHGLGLPDFYDTWSNDSDDSEGIGHWGLMGSGNYRTPLSPAYMEGYSRLFLGWASLRDIGAGGVYTLGSYALTDSIIRITPTGPNPRGEFFLLENRRPDGSDAALVGSYGPGLLIFHVDQAQIAQWQGANRVNSGPIHGLALEQADGLNQLRSSTAGYANRGDAGDPYPGSSGNTSWAFASTPPARLNTGAYPGFAIDSITEMAGGAIRFRVSFGPAPSLAAADTALRSPVMGAPFADTLVVSGSAGVIFTLTDVGTLPAGLSLSQNGIITGIATRDSTWNFVVQASAPPYEPIELPLRMTVVPPSLQQAGVLAHVTGTGSPLTVDEQHYLDLLGNRNGYVDVGDLAAWMDRTGEALAASRRGRR